LEKLKNTRIGLPTQNDLSKNLMEQNMLPPQNQSLYPRLKDDHVKLVLYVHNRPEYLRVVVVGLSGVEGIEETLLIVSHDGFFEEMNSICARHTILPGSCSCSISKMLGLHS
jgi:alpha-1,6-mannosyl-glycoprotein beta-1,2-N-acetylglucosaminyltransferase